MFDKPTFYPEKMKKIKKFFIKKAPRRVLFFYCSLTTNSKLCPFKKRNAKPFSLFVTSATNTSFKASVTCSISSSFSIFIRTSSLYVFCSRYIVILLYHSLFWKSNQISEKRVACFVEICLCLSNYVETLRNLKRIYVRAGV